jgi:hypothetical protein
MLYTSCIAGRNGYCKYLGKDGNAIYLERAHGPTIQRAWSFIAGTGKWKGITDGGDYNTPEFGASTKVQVKDALQNCVQVTGTYKLPGS